MRPFAIDEARSGTLRRSERPERVGDEVDDDAGYDDRTPFARAIAVIDPFVRDQAARHPFRLLGGAALLGFALGGGLSSRIARIAAFAAVRHASGSLWRELAAEAITHAVPHDDRVEK